ncbi:hypothetical protein J2741_001539 [Methanolinea mesophila]|uniref:hypothetical protein n=1 Tax=Methanolinea mesophila TaxID=547055 RepID=UPI001AE69C61|nr:hypothetical protein [Methanolinea mesophila]MBP1928992.1 hypothetical protein [Methanolinea mesophila]
MKPRIQITIVIALLFLFPLACADIPPPAVPETQGFSSATTMTVLGTATESDSMTWQISNLVLDALLSPAGSVLVSTDGGAVLVPELPVFDDILTDTPGEVQYSIAYSENTVADQGLIGYVKSSALDTANQVVGTRNLETSKVLEFVGFDTGRAVSSEDMVVDGAGSIGITDDLFICPFAAASTGITPEFCNIVEMGGDVDMTLMSLATTASERNVAASADVPVAADYSITVTGFGDIPASGSASAFIGAHLQEGTTTTLGTFNFEPFGDVDAYLIGKGEDVQYSETTTVSGEITAFSKVLSYQSGIRRIS